ncbi:MULTISPECIES: response regulator transcription factor [Pseudomonas]|uniref:Response regulator transcription factor n=1 Tax=Pseudomonas quercus TaxID=2722792 RepID=A0ABX0YH13_9PSED|nr:MULTISPECIES: response regulator transcription factor [Pseudomonas]MBF7143325.1 response regulator transcription factor [Pseudomonas sp. LY10J]NJP01629.1 response regulator transcription factor [Pseudomonas quercus]
MGSVLIIEDHPVSRLAVRMVLENEGYEIIGETDNGVDGMRMVRERMPQLIILDISLPRLDGLEVLGRFQAMGMPCRILVLTAQAPQLFAMRCMQLGAAGYVCKVEDLTELVSAVRAVFAGYNYFPSLTLDTTDDPERKLELALFQHVNDRELMVLQMFAQGRTNREIAEGMFLSNKTVSTYKKRLMNKLKARSLVDLLDIAKRNAVV